MQAIIIGLPGHANLSSHCMYLHRATHTPYLPPKLCITMVFHFSREMENNAYANFLHFLFFLGGGREGGGQIRCIIGDVQVAYCTSAFEVIAGRLSCDVTHHSFYHGLAIDQRVRGIHV